MTVYGMFTLEERNRLGVIFDYYPILKLLDDIKENFPKDEVGDLEQFEIKNDAEKEGCHNLTRRLQTTTSHSELHTTSKHITQQDIKFSNVIETLKEITQTDLKNENVNVLFEKLTKFKEITQALHDKYKPRGKQGWGELIKEIGKAILRWGIILASSFGGAVAGTYLPIPIPGVGTAVGAVAGFIIGKGIADKIAPTFDQDRSRTSPSSGVVKQSIFYRSHLLSKLNDKTQAVLDHWPSKNSIRA